jgi:hypothetical protein
VTSPPNFAALVDIGGTIWPDRPTKDIIPAADMGMRTVRVAIEESVPAVSRADFVCSSLEEVGRVVRRLSTTIA